MKKRGYPLTTALLALATVAAAAGFWRVFTGDTWILPLVAMVLSIHLLGWWFRRTNTPFPLAVIATVMVIALVSVWAVLPSSTSHGVPWTATWAAVQRAFDHLGDGVPHPPVHPDAGYMMEALWLVGIGAAVADWSAFRLGSALPGIVPAVGIFALCQVLGGSTHGTVLIAGLTGASTVYLLAHRATVGRARATWLGGSPNGYLRSVIRAGAIGVVATTAVAIGIGSQLPKFGGIGRRWADGRPTPFRGTASTTCRREDCAGSSHSDNHRPTEATDGPDSGSRDPERTGEGRPHGSQCPPARPSGVAGRGTGGPRCLGRLDRCQRRVSTDALAAQAPRRRTSHTGLLGTSGLGGTD